MSEITATLGRMQNIFRDVLDEESLELRPDMTAADVEKWDSLTHINLIVAIEREFRVRFSTAEVASLANVGDLAGLIEKKQSAKR
jgi:acyl carrier protein